jgi:hypothetical protein
MLALSTSNDNLLLHDIVLHDYVSFMSHVYLTPWGKP